MIYSEATNYALHTVAVLAQYDGEKKIGVKDLAEDQGISATYLSKILTKLVKKNLVVSTRGVAGGYGLARPAEQISFLDIIQAIEGEVPAFSGCIHPSPEVSCRIDAVMQTSEELTHTYLANKKISEVLK